MDVSMTAPANGDAGQTVAHSIQGHGSSSRSTPAYSSASSVSAHRRPSISGISRQAKRCPTCHGSGRLPIEGDSELMALIPYRDQRLKPRRTKLKVAVAVIVVIIICALLVFFLYPRAPTFSVRAAAVSHNITHPDRFQIVLEVNCTVHNNNFFKLSVDRLNIDIQQVSDILGRESLPIGKSIPSHSYLHLNRRATGVIYGDQGRHVVRSCEMSRVEKVFLQINVQLITTFLSNTGQSNSVVPNFFSCGSSDS